MKTVHASPLYCGYFVFTSITYVGYVATITFLAPFMADDYVFSQYGFIQGIHGYIESYFNWNARIGELLVRWVASAGKGLFLVLNPLVQYGLLLVCFFLLTGRLPLIRGNGDLSQKNGVTDVLVFTLLAGMMLTFVAAPGETLFWISGAMNYSWSAGIWLSYLCWFRCLLTGPAPARSGWLTVVIAVHGCIGGLCNEIIGPVTLAALGGLLAWQKYRFQRMPVWVVLGLSGYVAGLAAFWLAPGGYVRLMHPDYVDYLQVTVWQKLALVPKALSKVAQYGKFLIVPVLGYAFICRKKSFIRSVDNVLGWFFMLSALAMGAAFAFAPYITARAYYIMTLFCVLAAIAFGRPWLPSLMSRYSMRMLYAAAMLPFVLWLVLPTRSYVQLWRAHAARIAVMEHARQAGQMDVDLKRFRIKRWGYVFVSDVKREAEQNGAYARSFGLRSVRRVE